MHPPPQFFPVNHHRHATIEKIHYNQYRIWHSNSSTAMAPYPLSFLTISCIILSASGQGYRGPGYLACPFVDFFSTADSVLGCIDVNCTSAQLEACNSDGTVGEATDASFQTYYVELPCECFVADACPESCELFTGDLPTLPPATGFVNYTGVGIVTCPIAYYVSDYFSSDCNPTILDPALCGTCTTTIYDPAICDVYQTGDTTITIPLVCECIAMLNCPNTCTFVANDGIIVTPIAAPVAAPSTTDSPVSAPTSDETTTPVSAPSIDQGNGAVPVSAPISDKTETPVSLPNFDKGNTTGPVSTPSAPIRSPASSTSVAIFITSHMVCAVTAVLTMMCVLAF